MPKKVTISNRQMWRLWMGIKQRCYNPLCKDYARYGGRGIGICERWHDFNLFLSDVGIKPEGKSLDRTDNGGDYSPENCRWATAKEQAAHRDHKKASGVKCHCGVIAVARGLCRKHYEKIKFQAIRSGQWVTTRNLKQVTL